jgi:hypothetical protein
MKSNWIMKLTLSGLVPLLLYGAAYSQQGMLNLEVKPVVSTIGPIDPLMFNLVLTNKGASNIEGLPIWAVRSTTLVEYRASGSNDWQVLEVPILNRLATKCGVPGNNRITLKAGESLDAELFVVYDPYISYQRERPYYYFEKPGEYYLRASYQPAEGQVVYSNEVRFKVESYTGVDLDAYNWLKNKPLPHFMYDPETYVLVEMHEADEWAQELMDRFPNSRFAPWAQLYLANCYLLGLRTATEILPPDVVQADRLAAGLANSSDSRIKRSAEKLMQAIEQKRVIQHEDR